MRSPELKSLRSTEHIRLREMLVEARDRAGLTQAQVAQRLGKPQSFVSKYETGERRLDVVEFIKISKAIELDPARAVREIAASYGKK